MGSPFTVVDLGAVKRRRAALLQCILTLLRVLSIRICIGLQKKLTAIRHENARDNSPG